MFKSNSRYANLETATYTTSEGREIAYVRRRFLPRGEELTLLVEVEVGEGDRLDLITFRSLGEPEQFWQVCDANNALHPFDLTSEAGRVLRVAIPQFQEVR